MNLEFLTDPAHPMYSEALALYRESFPLHEQREAPSQQRILSDSDYRFGLLRDGQTFVGLALYWDADRFLYVEHLCILPSLRNRQYGKAALDLLARQGKLLILEIDPPMDDLSRRRKGFYERCGFLENPFSHIHPPYHRGNRGHDLILMTSPRPLSREEYDDFRRYLEERVMDRAFP